MHISTVGPRVPVIRSCRSIASSAPRAPNRLGLPAIETPPQASPSAIADHGLPFGICTVLSSPGGIAVARAPCGCAVSIRPLPCALLSRLRAMRAAEQDCLHCGAARMRVCRSASCHAHAGADSRVHPLNKRAQAACAARPCGRMSRLARRQQAARTSHPSECHRSASVARPSIADGPARGALAVADGAVGQIGSQLITSGERSSG